MKENTNIDELLNSFIDGELTQRQFTDGCVNFKNVKYWSALYPVRRRRPGWLMR